MVPMSNIGRGAVRVAIGAPVNVVLFQNSDRTPVWPGAPGGESTDDGTASGPCVRSAGAGASAPRWNSTSTPCGARRRIPSSGVIVYVGLVTAPAQHCCAAHVAPSPTTAIDRGRLGRCNGSAALRFLSSVTASSSMSPRELAMLLGRHGLHRGGQRLVEHPELEVDAEDVRDAL